MKIRNFLDPYKILTENMLVNEWTWGFELEAICHTPGDYTIPGYKSYSEDNQPTGVALELKMALDKLFGVPGKMERDGSVKPSSKFGGFSFEYPSGIFEFNLKEMKRILNILYEELPKLNVYTNRTCGFHTHFSNNKLDKNDVVWLLCCISLDENLRKELKELNSKVDDKESDMVKNLIKNIYHFNETGEVTNLPGDVTRTNGTIATEIKNHPEFGNIKIQYLNNGQQIKKIIINNDSDTYERNVDKDFYDINYKNNSNEIESIEGGINFFNETYANLNFFDEVRQKLIDIYLLEKKYFYNYKNSLSDKDDLPKENNKIGDTYRVLEKNDKTNYYFWSGKSWENITKSINNGNMYNQLVIDPYDKIKDLFRQSEKYRIMNTHSQGTLEWRGPRNFLSTGKKEIIFEYLKKCYRILEKMSNIIDKKEFTAHIDKNEIINRLNFDETTDINNIITDTITIKRDMIEKNIESNFRFNSEYEKHKTKRDSIDALYDAIKKHPEKILRLKYSELSKILDKLDIVNDIPVGYMIDLWKKLDDKTLSKIAESDRYKFEQWLTLLIRNNYDVKISEEIAKLFYNDGYFCVKILPYLNFIPMKYILRRYGDSNEDDKKIRNFLITHNSLIENNDWEKLLSNPNLWEIFSYLPLIPVKIQMKLVRKNPYFIQYIKNPDQSVINFAKKKVDNIEQFISRI